MANPSFIPRGGEYSFPPPYRAENVQYYAWILDADLGALQDMCDRYLNAPLGGKRRYTPVGPFVMMVALKLDHLRSLTPPYDAMGMFVEKEMAVWVMIIDEVEKRMFWFIPYMWVDNGYAMVNGRELFGFPKQLGTFDIPATADKADLLTMETLVFKKFSPDTYATTIKLISIARTTEIQHEFTPGAIANDFGAMTKELLRLLGDEMSLLGNAKTLIREMDDLVHLNMPMVFIKEFRDATNTTGACFQSVVELVPNATKVHGWGLLPNVYAIDIELCDSHPIRTDCGLTPTGPIKSKLGFWLNFDMDIPLGTETIIS
jgi:hypothetical protein